MNIYLLILGMMLVTMIPRILPFYTFDSNKVPDIMKVFLQYIPYCVLGALILPGGFDGIEGKPIESVICLIVAGLLAWKKGGIILPVLGSVILAIILI